jgi:ketosteroid isomerase-like protein
MVPITVALSILLLAAPAGTCQNQSAEGNDAVRILSLENAWNQAEMKHDVKAMDLLIAETFVYTDDDGTFMDRIQWMAHVRGTVDQYDELGNTDMQVHVIGDVALVTGRYHARLRIKGKSVIRAGRFTDVWTQRNNAWKCIASQSTLVSP